MARAPRIDEKIARAADFARPILEHLRTLVHPAIPDAGEAIRWAGRPEARAKRIGEALEWLAEG